MGVTSRHILTRRWLIRGYAFAAILTYGVYILSSQKQLKNLLDAAFDVASSSPSYKNIVTDQTYRTTTPYHNHIHGRKNKHDGSGGNSDDNKATRISFELHDPKTKPIKNTFNLYVTCPLGNVMGGNKRNKQPTGEVRSGELPPSLKRVVKGNDELRRRSSRSGRVLDFTISISTNLKLLLIGDSVMVQLSQAFDELIGMNDIYRKTVWEAWNGHDGGTIVAPTRGGGVSALWRMTGLLSTSRKGKPPANSAGGGWSDKEINTFKTYSYNTTTSLDNDDGQAYGTANNNTTTTTIDNFDIVVLRVMHGWMKVHEITHGRLVEAIELSGELLGAKTVVLMTIPFTNNVKTVEEMTRINEINNDIRQIAHDWRSSRIEKSEKGSGDVQHVLVLEYGTFYNHIIWSNARYLGYNVSDPLEALSQDIDVFDLEGPSFLLDRLQDGQEWSPSIPMVCSDTTSLGTDRKICNRNYLFLDGMHICPESLASRYAAGLACLIGCVYNERGEGTTTTQSTGTNITTENEDSIRACERECNEQFMSVMPVEESWIDANITLASFSR